MSTSRRNLQITKTHEKHSKQQAAPIQRRVRQLIGIIATGMVEREEIVAVALLGALCGQSTFLYGPPGTAKSLIGRRIACAFQQPAYFEYLMNRFSTPEEVFGPVSIKALKEDQYLRKTDSYLPKADFAFLDEIWKASPAILNTLLTLINERLFKNGETVEHAPLKALIAASNETPDFNQGLDALFDRFIVRLMVAPIGQLVHFEQLLNSAPVTAEVPVPQHLRVTSNEWGTWMAQIQTVALSKETMTIFRLVRAALAEQHDALRIYVSDRRWQRAALLMKAAAFFNGRTETNHSDALLMQHCIWTHKDNYAAVTEIVAAAVKVAGIESGLSLYEMDRKKELLDKEINDELFHSCDVYDTEEGRNGEQVFKYVLPASFQVRNNHRSNTVIYIPYKYMKSTESFPPVDQSGNEYDHITCAFDGQGSCRIKSDYSRQSEIFDPTILFHKNDKKSRINSRLVMSLAAAVAELRGELNGALKQSRARFTQLEAQLASLFVPPEKTALAITGIAQQIDDLSLRIKDCERLEGLCN